MAGLLDGFLPWVYSTGNQVRRNVRGLLEDPRAFVGSMGQDIDEQNRQRSKDYGLLFNPGVMTSPQERQQAMTRAAQEAVNYAAPTVWHGSPHKFDKFDSSKIGTGEGAQAYGHGLYLAETADVARTYQPRDMKMEEKIMSRYSAAEKSQQYPAMQVYEDFLLHKTPDEVADNIKNAGYGPQDLKLALAAHKQAKKEYFNQRAGNLYKVDLPDSAVAKMLDWDKPLSEQPEAVRALKKLADEFPDIAEQLQSFELKNSTGMSAYASIDRMIANQKDLYDKYGVAKRGGRGSDSAASEVLRNAGIPGIRYLDGGSRGAGTGTRNYVVFPGGEGLLNIMERNGQPLIR